MKTLYYFFMVNKSKLTLTCYFIFMYTYTRSRTLGDFYGTGIEIWAGFGPVWQLWRPFFFRFSLAKKNLKNIVDGENIFGIE